MSVSRETRRNAYLALLERWGTALNLTSESRRSQAALNDLIEDCLCLVPHLPHQLGRLVDLGSGQGFPAIPIAIETGVTIDLIESDRRKAAFLTTVMAELGLEGTVHATRIENVSLDPALCVTARALAPMSHLISLARPLLAVGGTALFLKGESIARELQDVPGHHDMTIEILPTTRPPSTLVKVTRLG